MKFEGGVAELDCRIYNSRNLLMKFEEAKQELADLSTTVEIY